jgi:hypothetical protein
VVQNSMPRLSNKIYYLNILFNIILAPPAHVRTCLWAGIVPAQTCSATRRSTISHNNVRRYIYQGRYSS